MCKRRNIGVITGNLEAPHSYELVQSMNRAARDYNANLLVFPGMHSKSFYEKRLLGSKEDYDYQFNTVYDFVEKEEIDFLLISLGTVIDFLGTERAEEFLEKFNNIPSIVLEDRGFDKTCVVLDNRTGLTKCMEHLIQDHGYRKIAFVTGRKSNFDAKERLDVYLSVMSKYKIPIEEGMIAYGDFTEYSDELVSGILDSHPDIEAICFANDMMVIGAYRECKKRGLIIGRDIAITGFDDIPQAVSLTPPLTTVRVKPYRIGYQAVAMAMDIMDGKPCGSRVLGSEFVIRESCGCVGRMTCFHENNKRDDRRKWISEMKSFLIGESFHHSESEDRGIHLCNKIYDIVELVADVFTGNEKKEGVFDELTHTLQYLLLKEHVEFFSLDKLEYAFRYFFEEVSQRTRNNELQKELSRLATVFCQTIRTTALNEGSRLVKRYKKEAWYSTYIVQDAMIYSLNEKEALYQIVDKMRMLHFKRAYIFLFKEPIV
ncbi:MAG: substrate-binding domain-containing protein, partial [Lachnospiraceae bacterium]|nr:substrate-binding domain-containing protein [Lachnospiraceae bacterium]